MSKVVPFGKYKGQPVERLVADRNYCDWLAQQPWFRERFNELYQLAVLNVTVVNVGSAEPQDTPLHNLLQALFLEEDNCKLLAWAIVMSDTEQSKRRPLTDVELENTHKILDITFENQGWDLTFEHHQARVKRPEVGPPHISWDDGWVSYYLVELKPVIGDDYPQVLRQVKGYPGLISRNCRRGRRIVYAQDFEAVVPLASVKKIFESKSITLLTHADAPMLQRVALGELDASL